MGTHNNDQIEKFEREAQRDKVLLDDELQNLLKERDYQKIQQKKLFDQESRQESEVDSAKQTIQDLVDQDKALRDELRTLTNQEKQAENEFFERRVQANDATRSKQEFDALSQALSSRIAELQARKRALELKLANERQNLEILQRKQDSNQKQISELQRQLDDLQSQIRECVLERQQLDTNLKNAENQLHQLDLQKQRELDALSLQVNQLKEDLAMFDGESRNREFLIRQFYEKITELADVRANVNQNIGSTNYN